MMKIAKTAFPVLLMRLGLATLPLLLPRLPSGAAGYGRGAVCDDHGGQGGYALGRHARLGNGHPIRQRHRPGVV